MFIFHIPGPLVPGHTGLGLILQDQPDVTLLISPPDPEAVA